MPTRHARLAVVLVLALLASAPVADGAAARSDARGFAVGADPVLMPARAPAFWATLPAAGQDPPAVEAALSLDRPTRQLIQQGLRNEGFDAGAPDGLFGPRTRAAIRDWQAARGATATGYLSGGEAELLRAAAVVEPPAPPVQTENCDEWNTEAFFKTATASTVRACLAAGVDVAARTDDGHTPLHMAADFNIKPAVLDALLNAGADMLVGTDGDGHTPLHEAAGNSNPAILEVLLDAGGNPETRTNDGATLLHWAASLNDNPAVLEALLAAGADIAARNDDGGTPLTRAAWRNENPAVIDRGFAGRRGQRDGAEERRPVGLVFSCSEQRAGRG